MEAMMRSDESSESPVFRTVCGICTGTCGIALTLNLPERKILR
jgi:heterodisulfide reductase subunit C